MMYYEKYGDEHNPIIVCLHGANHVHCFSKQCEYLSKNYCVIVPHLPGYGRNEVKTFKTVEALKQLVEFIPSLGKKVTLMGFSVGAQLAFVMLCKAPQLFNGVIMISPWLLKDPAEVEKAMKQASDNEKLSKNKLLVGFNALAMGLDKGEREENAEFAQNVTMTTILNSIDNGIKFEDFPDYRDIDVPMLALCGIKETLEIRKSVRTLSMQNPHCAYDMWDGAAHNIPFKAASRLNKIVEEFMEKNGKK